MVCVCVKGVCGEVGVGVVGNASVSSPLFLSQPAAVCAKPVPCLPHETGERNRGRWVVGGQGDGKWYVEVVAA